MLVGMVILGPSMVQTGAPVIVAVVLIQMPVNYDGTVTIDNGSCVYVQHPVKYVRMV